LDTMKSRTEILIPCSFSVSFVQQSVAVVMGLVRLSQPAHGRYGFQLALVCLQKQMRNAGKRAFRKAMCNMKRLPFVVISWG